MRRVSHSRDRGAGLLVRPPYTARDVERGWASLYVDPVEQLEELADLSARGVLSPDEFERQKWKVLGS
jgi:hypothetical protein